MKRVFITGAAGFVGANLARRLVEAGHETHLCVRASTDQFRLKDLQTHAQKHEVDLQDKVAVANVLKSVRPDWIFHLAACGAYSWQTDPSQMVQDNVLGTSNLLEAAIKVGFDAFVNTGSSSEYGFKSEAPSEEAALEPNSNYAVTKASATMYCMAAARQNRLHIPTLRLYSVFGPFEEPRRLIPTLISHALDKRLPPLVKPKTARDFIYVDDVVDAYLLAARANVSELGAVYNVGSGKQTQMEELITICREIFNIEEEPLWNSMENRAWDTDSWVSDNSKIKEQLGFTVKTSLTDGLLSTSRWMQETPAMLTYYRSRCMTKNEGAERLVHY